MVSKFTPASRRRSIRCWDWGLSSHVLQRAGGDLPHVVHGGQFFLRGRHQRVQRAEARRKDLPRLTAHLTDAEGVEQAGQVLSLGLVNGGNEVLR